ncbi:hypothetical protein [Ruania halotolerans]|uniref:hypothetical protein n=1 Tax=Ruania halotolerans TaxID=2897773 RepID=UPI001E3B0A60|nr:hypothetical protein [Ruania halotolerans]UFU07184.1 hypothetical protein LQF10_03480 [Ruania halotolerans]
MARSTRRLAAVLALAATTALGAGACSPITTMEMYAPSDGVRADLGESIRVENLMVLSASEGGAGAVLGAVVNDGAEPTEVTLTAEGVSGGLVLSVDAGATLLLGPDHEDVTLPAVAVPPGAVLEMQVSAPEAGSTSLDVPVLDGAIPPYDEYLPAENGDPASS